MNFEESCLINKSQFSSDRKLLAQRSKRAILHFAHGSFAASKKGLTKHCISLAICLSPPYDGDSCGRTVGLRQVSDNQQLSTSLLLQNSITAAKTTNY